MFAGSVVALWRLQPLSVGIVMMNADLNIRLERTVKSLMPGIHQVYRVPFGPALKSKSLTCSLQKRGKNDSDDV